VQSAYGNATDQEAADPDGLIVSECRVDGAPMFKRIQPRARGTAFQIKCRMSHIVVTLSEPPEEVLETPTMPAPAPVATTPAPAAGPTAGAPAAPAPTGSEPTPTAPPEPSAEAPAPTPPTSGA
jgi:large subunit ribosomal protein L22